MYDTKKTVYLSIAGMDPGWIVGKIAEDILAELKSNNITCRYGAPDGYQGEQIVYHLGYAYAKPQEKAEINSVFITHIDDKLKEKQIVDMKDDFDSFICMSHEYREFLRQLGFDKDKVFGVTLPTRNDYVRPVSLGIFSSYYSDNRKNEKWLFKFIEQEENAHLLNFVFIGPNWGVVLDKFSQSNVSFEWHNASRKLPYEYKFQQNKLSNLDHFFYLGFDGGAMGSYDAYAYGVPLMLSDDGYHKDIPNVENSFRNYEGFAKILRNIIALQKTRIDFFIENNNKNYVATLYKIWLELPLETTQIATTEDVVALKRGNYFSITARRLASALKRKLLK